MAEPVPEWLNESFLETCLQKEYKGQIKVDKLTIAPAVPAGNNYGSCLLRVNVELKKDGEKEAPLSVIVKSPHLDESQREMFENLNDVETTFYNEFLPLASKLNERHFAPKCYFSPNRSIMVLEDLKEGGYVMADRCSQLDFDHCRLYAIASATFHAVSVAVHKSHPELIELLGVEKLYSNEVKLAEVYKKLIPKGLECIGEYMEKTEYKKYSKLVSQGESYLWDKVMEAHKPNKVLNSLNQGDPWTPNMMFRYDESNRVCDIKLLDFQALRYSSPINDLVFFLWTSAQHEVRENRYDEFLHIYCDTLNSKLKDLNCSERLAFTDLMKAIENLSPLVLMVTAIFVPMQVHPGTIDISDILTDEVDEKSGKQVNKLTKYFNENFCQKFLSRVLKQFDILGVFAYLERNCV